jgi:hypothetical protein
MAHWLPSTAEMLPDQRSPCSKEGFTCTANISQAMFTGGHSLRWSLSLPFMTLSWDPFMIEAACRPSIAFHETRLS